MLVHLIIIMYIYHALINALSADMIHINLNMIFYTHLEHSPTKTIYIKYYTKKQTNKGVNSKRGVQSNRRCHCSLQCVTAHCLVSLFTAMCHCSLSCVTAHYLVTLPTVLCHYSLPCVTAHYLVTLVTVLCHCSLPCVIAHCLVSLLTAMYYCSLPCVKLWQQPL